MGMVSNDTRIWVADMEPSTRYPLYTRGNTGEVFPNVITALTGTLIGDDVGRAQMEVFAAIGFVTRRDLDGIRLGTGVFGGYLYGSGSLARIMGVRTPGMNSSTSDEQVFGTVDGVPPYRPAKGDRNLVATVKISRYLAKVMRHPDLAPLDRARDDATAWLASMPPLVSSDDAELLAFVDTYPRRLAESMKRLLHFSLIATGPRVLLDRMLVGRDLPSGTANRLVSGVDDIDSARLAQQQWVLGRIVADDDSLMAAFDEGLDGIAERVRGLSAAGATGALPRRLRPSGQRRVRTRHTSMGHGRSTGVRRHRAAASCARRS